MRSVINRRSRARTPEWELDQQRFCQFAVAANYRAVSAAWEPVLKILLCHNYYQQPGGEDQCFLSEGALLESEGHDVVRYTRHNDDIKDMRQIQVAGKTIWNRQTYLQIRELIRREQPAIVHCTNIFPLISPAVYYAAAKEGVPVVQSLHNYRLMCANAYFLRDGKTCEKCVGKIFAWPAVTHACYKQSFAGSAAVAGAFAVHRVLRTFQRRVDVFVALTEFARGKFVEGGIPAEKLVVNPNFLSISSSPGTGAGGYAVYVGRLSPEKGIDILLEAWSQLGQSLKLKIVGDGPLADQVRAAGQRDDRIEWMGYQSPKRVLELLSDAACLIIPSIWYEGLPRTIVEAFAVGTPVIASRIGSLTDLISDGQNGFHFESGNAEDLKRAIELFFSEQTDQTRFRKAARTTFDQQFTASAAYRNLMTTYAKAAGKTNTDFD